jgi:hypothetical protein
LTDSGGSLAFLRRFDMSASLRRFSMTSTAAGNEKSEQGEPSVVSDTTPQPEIGDQEKGHVNVPVQQQEQEQEQEEER